MPTWMRWILARDGAALFGKADKVSDFDPRWFVRF
jgi:hypothetical protein